ncbi:hypothetical protein Tco_0528027 [Tanacetum coccineum]
MVNEMIRNNLTVATMQVNVQFLQQLQPEPEWQDLSTIVKQQHKRSEEDSDPEQAQKDKDMQKKFGSYCNVTFEKIYKTYQQHLRTSSNTRNKNVDTTLRYKNDNQTGQFGNQRVVNVVGARETVGGLSRLNSLGLQCFKLQGIWFLCKDAESQNGLKTPAPDEEIDEQELEAHYSYMAKIQEVPNADLGTDAEPLE